MLVGGQVVPGRGLTRVLAYNNAVICQETRYSYFRMELLINRASWRPKCQCFCQALIGYDHPVCW
jgi:hypothetical protein